MVLGVPVLKHFRVNSEDPDEVARFEPPHLDLCCLQIQQFTFHYFYI